MVGGLNRLAQVRKGKQSTQVEDEPVNTGSGTERRQHRQGR